MPDRRRLRGAAMIARRLGVSRSSVYDYWQHRGLPCFKVAGPTSPLCIFEDELERWIAEKREAPAGGRG